MFFFFSKVEIFFKSFWTLRKVSGHFGNFLDTRENFWISENFWTLESFWTLWNISGHSGKFLEGGGVGYRIVVRKVFTHQSLLSGKFSHFLSLGQDEDGQEDGKQENESEKRKKKPN